ncbi:MAG TPA: tetratricopeptide repeat protein [Rhodanobacteraceae bacterium]|nr:tetratricopeptide repeat protein [Rhodanobacteraceae bacterium]
MRWAILLALGVTTVAGAASTDELMRQAQAGDVVAQRQFGQALLQGVGVPQDVPAGLEWLQQAAAQNDPHAAFLLAKYYESQPKTAATHNAVVRYYRRAAAAGHTTAQARLGEMLLERTDDPSLGESDRERARTQGMALLQFAADANNGYAALSLAVIRTEGRYGVAVDKAAGLALYERAAATGQTAAATFLSAHYLQGTPTPQDLQRGVGYLVQAANDGVPSAMLDLASRFARGAGVPQDSAQASSWAQRAKAAGVDVSAVLADIAAQERKRSPGAPDGDSRDVLAVVPKRLEVVNPPPSTDKDGDPDHDDTDGATEGLQGDFAQPARVFHDPLATPAFTVAMGEPSAPHHLTIDLPRITVTHVAPVMPIEAFGERQASLPAAAIAANAGAHDTSHEGATAAPVPVHAVTPSPAAPRVAQATTAAPEALLPTTRHEAAPVAPAAPAPEPVHSSPSSTLAAAPAVGVRPQPPSFAPAAPVPAAPAPTLGAPLAASVPPASHAPPAAAPPPVTAAAEKAALSAAAVAQLAARLEALEHQVQSLEQQRNELRTQLAERDATLAQLRTVRDQERLAADKADATVEAVRNSLAHVNDQRPAPKAEAAAPAPATPAQIEAWNQEGLAAVKMKDYAKALVVFGRSAEAGNGTALNNLGMMHMRGMGVPESTRNAITYFERAVAVGHGGAANNLGYIWAHGMGVTADVTQARRWYKRGVELGNASAAKALQRLDSPAADLVAQVPPAQTQG